MCVVFSRKARQRTHTESCPRLRPGDDTSASLSGSLRTASSRRRIRHSVCRVATSPLQDRGPPATLLRPRAFVKWSAVYAELGIMPFHGRPLQKCSPKIGRVSPLHRFGELSVASDPNRHRDRRSAEDTPFLSPTRNPVRYAHASLPPIAQAFQLHRCRLRRQRSTSNARPDIVRRGRSHGALPQQHRGEGHSRSYPGDITVNQTNRPPLHILLVAVGLSGQPIPAQAAPREDPGLATPKRKARSQKDASS